MTVGKGMETDRPGRTVAYLRFWKSDGDSERIRGDIVTFARGRGFGQIHFVEEEVSDNVSWVKSKVKAIIDEMGKGDVLIVQDLSHLSASMLEIREIISIAGEKGFLLYEAESGCAIDIDLVNRRIKEKRLKKTESLGRVIDGGRGTVKSP
ncbi:MAG: recombinase family protein [Thermodesulfobacteriota bacterium]